MKNGKRAPRTEAATAEAAIVEAIAAPVTQLKPSTVAKHTEPEVDRANLLMIDRDPLEKSGGKKGKNGNLDEAVLLKLARDNTQYLFNELWTLPHDWVEQAICAKLPPTTYVLPREKPVPKPREPTKWERFAAEKGIGKNKSRGRKVWDDSSQDWKPRYGYRRANNDSKDWLIEIPDQKDPYKNYFEERSQQKSERTDKYEFQRLRNLRKAMSASGGNATPLAEKNGPPSAKKSAGTPAGAGKEGGMREKMAGRKAQAKEVSKELTNRVHYAKKATASIGNFEPNMKGERKPRVGERRKFTPNIDSDGMAAEKRGQLAILEKLQSKKPKLVQSNFNAVHDSGDGGGEERGAKRPRKQQSGGRSGGRQSHGKGRGAVRGGKAGRGRGAPGNKRR